MKHLLSAFVILLLTASLVLAAQGGGAPAGTGGSDAAGSDQATGNNDADGNTVDQPANGATVETTQQIQNKGEEQQLQTQQQAQLRLGNPTTIGEAKAQVQEQKRVMEQELQGMSEKGQKVYRNQNQVREAVHALLALEGVTGGIGQQVSAVAKEFNNSVQATIRAEQRIETRSGFTRFFAGGDAAAAKELEQETTRNRERLQQLQQLHDSCADCGTEAKTMLQEQIKTMEQEQTRLRELADKEQKSKGLFGWMWK